MFKGMPLHFWAENFLWVLLNEPLRADFPQLNPDKEAWLTDLFYTTAGAAAEDKLYRVKFCHQRSSVSISMTQDANLNS